MYVVGAWELLLLEQVHHCTTNSTTVSWHTHQFHSNKWNPHTGTKVFSHAWLKHTQFLSENINMPNIGAHAPLCSDSKYGSVKRKSSVAKEHA